MVTEAPYCDSKVDPRDLHHFLVAIAVKGCVIREWHETHMRAIQHAFNRHLVDNVLPERFAKQENNLVYACYDITAKGMDWIRAYEIAYGDEGYQPPTPPPCDPAEAW